MSWEDPFSALSFFTKQEFANYWLTTGTPIFLIEQVKERNDLESFAESREVWQDSLKGDGSEKIETTALLFQNCFCYQEG
jgi:hypothetical protein